MKMKPNNHKTSTRTYGCIYIDQNQYNFNTCTDHQTRKITRLACNINPMTMSMHEWFLEKAMLLLVPLPLIC